MKIGENYCKRHNTMWPLFFSFSAHGFHTTLDVCGLISNEWETNLVAHSVFSLMVNLLIILLGSLRLLTSDLFGKVLAILFRAAHSSRVKQNMNSTSSSFEHLAYDTFSFYILSDHFGNLIIVPPRYRIHIYSAQDILVAVLFLYSYGHGTLLLYPSLIRFCFICSEHLKDALGAFVPPIKW